MGDHYLNECLFSAARLVTQTTADTKWLPIRMQNHLLIVGCGKHRMPPQFDSQFEDKLFLWPIVLILVVQYACNKSKALIRSLKATLALKLIQTVKVLTSSMYLAFLASIIGMEIQQSNPEVMTSPHLQ